MAKSNITWPLVSSDELGKVQAVITKGDSLPFAQGFETAKAQFGAAKTYMAWIAIPSVQAVYKQYNNAYSQAYAALTIGRITEKDAEILRLREQVAKLTKK